MYMNQITIVGNVTRNAEAITTHSGKQVTRFAVAVNRGKDQPTDFFEIAAWEKAWAVDVAKKGVLVLVQGSMRSSRSEDGTIYWAVNADKILLMNRRETKKDDNGSKASSRKKDKGSEYPLYDEMENLR